MNRLLTRVANKMRPDDGERGSEAGLAARVAALEAAVEENRMLNQRLSDVLDVVTEVLVPAADRDDARLKDALAHLGKTLDDDAPRG